MRARGLRRLLQRREVDREDSTIEMSAKRRDLFAKNIVRITTLEENKICDREDRRTFLETMGLQRVCAEYLREAGLWRTATKIERSGESIYEERDSAENAYRDDRLRTMSMKIWRFGKWPQRQKGLSMMHA